MGDWVGELPKLPDGLTWKRGGFRYLGVFLGDSNALKRNWDGTIEKIKGRLNKWKWLVPQLSYRGRSLIINNLVASFLWHKLMVLDPPPNLLSKVQALLVDFFWDRLHWLPQSMLYLPKDEGGQGVIHLSSRGAAFRLQFIQRFLNGPENVTWRGVACEILHTLGNFGLDKALFLMDPTTLNTNGLPVFYRGLFKVWSLFQVQRMRCAPSLHWLLCEPILNGARLDVTNGSVAFKERLCQAKLTTLCHLVNVCGVDLKNVDSIAGKIGLKSVRTVRQILVFLKSVLTSRESSLLKDYGNGLRPDSSDPFPGLFLCPKIDECESSFFLSSDQIVMGVIATRGRAMYKVCVKILNKKWLISRTDTPWRNVLMMDDDTKPEWRALYKPPLTKRMGDLQWRVLHGIVATNSFITVLNPGVRADCPFCLQRETVFHVFMDCLRLSSLLDFLESLLQGFGEHFSKQMFILGFKYCKKNSSKAQLINYIFGNAKMSVYITRRNKIDQDCDYDAVAVFVRLIKARIQMEFKFYKSINNIDAFECVWCSNGVLCSVNDGELVLAHCLL